MKYFYQKMQAMPMWCAVAVVLIYSLLAGEVSRELAMPVLQHTAGIDPTALQIASIATLVSGVIGGLFTWALMSALYHVCALLFGGKEKIKNMFLLTGLAFLVYIPFVAVQIFLLQDISFAEGFDFANELQSHSTIVMVGHIGIAASIAFYAVIVPAVRYIYNLEWWKTALVVAIPSVLISCISLYTSSAIAQ